MICIYKKDTIFIEQDLTSETTVCFSGLRPKKFDYSNKKIMSQIYAELVFQILLCTKLGYDTFLCGGCAGFDIISAYAVNYVKKILPQVKLIFVLPYDNFYQSKEFDDHWREKYNTLIKTCVVLNPSHAQDYFKGCYMARNRFLIDHSSVCICLHDGKAGGTANTIQYGLENGREIINIYDVLH